MIASQPLVFSTRSYEFMGRQICELGGFEEGSVERKFFPDGERYQRLQHSPDARRVVLVGGTITDEDTLEYYDLACAISKLGAYSLTLVIPYFGYSTMERAAKPLEIVTAKSRARLLSSVPPAGISNRVILIDLHTPGLPHYFEGGVQAHHLYAKPLILESATRLGGEDFVLACTDAGRAKWVESLANDLGVEAAFILKRRLDGGTVEVAQVQAEVRGKKVVIYDDMVRTGGSLLQAAKAYLEAGASEVSAVSTHGVLPNGALERLQESGLLKKLVTTDTHPTAVHRANGFLETVSVAPLIVKALRELP